MLAIIVLHVYCYYGIKMWSLKTVTYKAIKQLQRGREPMWHNGCIRNEELHLQIPIQPPSLLGDSHSQPNLLIGFLKGQKGRENSICCPEIYHRRKGWIKIMLEKCTYQQHVPAAAILARLLPLSLLHIRVGGSWAFHWLSRGSHRCGPHRQTDGQISPNNVFHFAETHEEEEESSPAAELESNFNG